MGDDDPIAYLKMFRDLVAAARTRKPSRLVEAMDAVEAYGVRGRLRVAILTQQQVSTFAYPDYPAGEVDMRRYLSLIRTAYSQLGQLLDHTKLSYADFVKAVGNWATGDESVEPGIVWACHIAFLAVQWPHRTDEPDDDELLSALSQQQRSADETLSGT